MVPLRGRPSRTAIVLSPAAIPLALSLSEDAGAHAGAILKEALPHALAILIPGAGALTEQSRVLAGALTRGALVQAIDVAGILRMQRRRRKRKQAGGQQQQRKKAI
jgi:hypothetical protein